MLILELFLQNPRTFVLTFLKFSCSTQGEDMLTELDEYLNSNISDDYWYDEALFICEDIIREFTDDDWN